jgi:hypothetical protein
LVVLSVLLRYVAKRGSRTGSVARTRVSRRGAYKRKYVQQGSLARRIGLPADYEESRGPVEGYGGAT